MHSAFDETLSKAFIRVARQRDLLSDGDADTLLTTSTEQLVMPSQLALDLGLMSPVEVEIVEAFMAPHDLAPGYELLDVLGHGALGIVYRADQPRLRRSVAIKSIIRAHGGQQNALARFQQEGTAIGRLQHPNIVSAYDSGSHRDRLYLVMELVDGADLLKRLERGPLDPSTALSIVRQTASGLSHAHANQIIHRDIKPGNLILTEAPVGFDLPPGVPLVKIADFGLARLNLAGASDQLDTRLTLSGAALGTPMYCAPEQLTGDAIDHRADIYALGATFLQMLTAETPYESDKVSKIIAAKVTGQTPRFELLPDDLDPSIRQLLLDMMHHDPDQRVADYDELIARVDKIHDPRSSTPGGATSALGAVGNVNKSSRLIPSRRWIVPIVLAVGLLVAAMALPSAWNQPVAPSMVPSGWEQHLFDGKTITGWTDQSGLWLSSRDSEGGAILVGKGSIVRPFPTFPPPTSDVSDGHEVPSGHGVRVGTDLQQAESAEIHFGFESASPSAGQRLVVRYTATQVALGTRDGIEGDFVQIGESLQLKSTTSDSPAYHEIRIELHGRHWFVYFDGDVVANAVAELESNNRAIQLVAPDGEAHFEGPSVYGLKEATN